MTALLNSKDSIIFEITKMTDNLLQIQNMIYEIRGQKVMLDSDLAMLYGVEVKNLNRAVKHNIDRFPDDFMFQLTEDEFNSLRCKICTLNTIPQKATANLRGKHRKYLPYVFTEHGILMLSSVLNSKKAIEVNIQIMRVFVKLRHYVFSKSDTNEQVAELRKLLMLYIEKNDKQVNEIIIVLNNLIEQPPKTKTIGFRMDKK